MGVDIKIYFDASKFILMLVNQCMEVLTRQEQGCTVTENVRGHAMGIWERVYNTEKFVLTTQCGCTCLQYGCTIMGLVHHWGGEHNSAKGDTGPSGLVGIGNRQTSPVR